MNLRLSVLDLAPIDVGTSAAESIAGSVQLARRAEATGYARVWYAEHHNMPTIASSATAVLIGHVAAHTFSIRLGAGGVMLPNHAPLVVAEQFGTLDAMYPGRIDLGLGRAPGTDRTTMKALRRGPASAHDFPDDVRELRAYLNAAPHDPGDPGGSVPPGIRAVPGAGSRVPLFILGSSLFGARLAADLGLPYAFASHFAPGLLAEALAAYRADFVPSEQLTAPYVIAGVNVVAADSSAEAQALVRHNRRAFARGSLPKGASLTETELDEAVVAGAARHFDALYQLMAVGDAAEVTAYLQAFAERTGADELITAHQAPTLEARLTSVTLTAQAMTSTHPATTTATT